MNEHFNASRQDDLQDNLSAASYWDWEAFCNLGDHCGDTHLTTNDMATDCKLSPRTLSENPSPVLSATDNHQPSATLPGLNKAVNLATVTDEERDFFLLMVPETLKDPQKLMDVVASLPIRLKTQNYLPYFDHSWWMKPGSDSFSKKQEINNDHTRKGLTSIDPAKLVICQSVDESGLPPDDNASHDAEETIRLFEEFLSSAS